MSEYTNLLASYRNPDGGRQVLLEAATELPSAASELATEAWEHPWDTAKHAIKTAGTAAVMGVALGAIIPSRGPAAAITGFIFGAPIVINGIRRIGAAYAAGERGDADIHAIAHGLARDTISGTVDLGLGFAGGFAGSEAGSAIASSNTKIGSLCQSVQRTILLGENKSMSALSKAPDLLKGASAEARNVGAGNLSEQASGSRKPWFAGKDSALSNRLAQFEAPEQEFNLRMGSLHGHSRYSDGMGLPKDIYAKAKAEGMDFYTITDHNHLAARGGIKPGDPRATDEAGTPIIAEAPVEYSQTFADAKAATQDGKFVGMVGIEMGTIGKVGGGHGGGIDGGHGSGIDGAPAAIAEVGTASAAHTHGHSVESVLPPSLKPPVPTVGNTVPPELPAGNAANHGRTGQPETPPPPKPLSAKEQAIADAAARDAGHYGGVNHSNVFETEEFFRATRQPKTETLSDILLKPFRRMLGMPAAEVVKPPTVIDYNDGDYAALVSHLDQLKDTSGGRPIIQLNHPRYLADEDPNLPAALRGRDYGVKSFKSQAEWREKFGKYASLIEVITGEALNPKPVEHMGEHDIAPVNLAGYIDKGLHVSPTYGRDDHFAMPGGRPAGTGILAAKLDKASLLEGMRERRTMATTSTKLLKGYMTANDAHPMGSILDQAAINDLNLKMTIGGELDPQAKYKVNLWGDTKIGDRKLATVMQSKDLLGQDLLDTQGQVSFDQVRHIIGNKSAYYVEVQRTDPGTSLVDYMWTAPIWVEPLSGQHSLLTRAMVGYGGQVLFGLSGH